MLPINKIDIIFFILSISLPLYAADLPLKHKVVDHPSFWFVVVVVAIEALLLAAMIISRHRKKGFSFAQVRLNSIMDSPSRLAVDLSEKSRMQRELEESQKFLRSVIDAMPIRVFWKDKDCIYRGCNTAFVIDSGLNSPSDIIGKKDSEMPWGDALAETYNDDDREVMRTMTSKMNFEESVVLEGHSSITVRTSKMPLLDVNNELVGMLGMYEDITDYKRLQELVEKRIVSLTRYAGDPDEQEFGKLFDINEIQRIQDEFSESTNISSVIVGQDGKCITAPSRTSTLCRFVMNLKDAPCERCNYLTSGLLGAGMTGPMFRRCNGSGLNMAVSPIIAGGVHVASWILGQVRVEEKSEDELVDSAKSLGLDPDVYLESYKGVPRMTKEKFESVAETAHTLCSQLSIFATQNIQQARLLKEEKERAEEIHKYHAAIEQIPDGVMIIDKNQKIQYANPAFTRITGYTQEEAVGMSPMVLSSERNSRETLQGIVATVKIGKVWSGRLINKRKDGTLYTEESVVTPVFDSSGEIVSFVATMRDITDELSREEDMYHRQKMVAVGQLAGGVAHDFNNILQAILGFSEILMHQMEPDSLAYRNAEQICIASKRAAALTRGLLALGRKEQKDEIPQDVDVNFMLQDSFLLLNLLSTENIDIIYDLEPELKPVCFSNDKLYQVIVNLVLNACDAMPEGGAITIKTENVSGIEHSADHAEDDGDFVRITVADEGCGISEEEREKVFDPFYTTKEVGKGSGIGLSIAYVIISDFGGEISFESKIGKGTKFFVYLPIKKV